MTESIKRSDGAPLPPSVPTHAVLPVPGLQACDQLTHADILIADFGESYLAAGPSSQYINTPLPYSPPEALLTMLLALPRDQTLTCILGEILSEQFLVGRLQFNADAVLANIVDSRAASFPKINAMPGETAVDSSMTRESGLNLRDTE
ncbi:MAG: hypothetical protein Q9176_005896 [Flavoplaca citrina]